MSTTIGVFMAARIIRVRTGDVVNLWWPERPFLTSVTIDMNLGYVSKLTATMEAPYKQGIALLEDPDLIVQGNILQVKLGYTRTGYSTPWYAGLIQPPGVEIGPNGVDITLEANGGGALAMTRTTSLTYSGSPISIIDQIAETYGWDVDILDRGEKKISTDTGKPYTTGQQAPWMLIREICFYSNYSYWIGSGADGKATLFLRDRASMLSLPARRTFVMNGVIDVSKNQYPLLSFGCDSSSPFLWPGSNGVKTIQMDDNGEIVELNASATTSSVPTLGAETGASGATDAAEDPDTKLKSDLTTAPDADADHVILAAGGADSQEVLQAIFDERASRAGMQGDGSSIGIPLMLPGDVVQIAGCSKLFDGPWGVLGVVHKVDSSGFETSWKMFKNGFPEGTGLTIPAPVENVTNKPADSADEGGGVP